MTHEDDRRILTSIPYKGGEIKIIITKKDCELGNHYHKIKTELFTLMEGSGTIMIKGIAYDIERLDDYRVARYEAHSFNLKKDSILVCICSHPYDKTDDYGV